MLSCRAVAVALLLLATGCGGDDDGAAVDAQPYVQLDGSPRHPDAEGVLEAVASDFETLTLDGDRTYPVAKDLQCFATQNGTTVPLLQRVGTYVQVGIEDGTVVWLAGIAGVVEREEGDVVYYVGEAIDLDQGRLIFDDGTVLTIDEGYDLPAPPEGGARITATIDPAKRAVVEIEPAA